MGLWGRGEGEGGLQCWGLQRCAWGGGSNGGSVLLLEGGAGSGVAVVAEGGPGGLSCWLPPCIHNSNKQ